MIQIDDICEQVAKESGVNPCTVKFCARKIFETIQDTMKEQEMVMIPGFGRFDFRQRKAHITTCVNDDRDTYTPANSAIHFTPDRKWAGWQRVHSCVIPAKLPEGTKLGIRLITSKHIRQQMGDQLPSMAEIQKNENALSFYENVIKARAIRKASKK